MLLGVAPGTTAMLCCLTSAKQQKKSTATAPQNRRADICSFCPRHRLFCFWCLLQAGGTCFENRRPLMDQSVNRGVRDGSSSSLARQSLPAQLAGNWAVLDVASRSSTAKTARTL